MKRQQRVGLRLGCYVLVECGELWGVFGFDNPRDGSGYSGENQTVPSGLMDVRIGAITFSMVLLILSTDVRLGFCAQSFAAP